ncbi:MAG: glucose dehydrogenase, partial [Kofleriaceae bacterium]
PWRFSFDPATGDLWIADVGQDTLEELDVLPRARQAGANLGWPMYEGSSCYTPPCDPAGLVFPLDEREHSNGWCAIIGGAMVRGGCYPDLAGEFFYSDNCHGGLFRARLVADHLEIVDPLAGDLPYAPTVIHANWRGELYVGDLFGNVARIEAQ